jgi:hypothetical protein
MTLIHVYECIVVAIWITSDTVMLYDGLDIDEICEWVNVDMLCVCLSVRWYDMNLCLICDSSMLVSLGMCDQVE